ncbi:hypothetical protein BH93_12945 [Rhodococcoides fascians A25f]|uniref:hypothetical protein n=1 Tax=Rhodococcoides fascians TaxID=1828 RepID=UPI000B117381|nr:hypothetical protein [Rhodococcus fascians]QII06159.1 hypothetical protein BH93_12945 [Rhodococcus fascians A25f]
MTSSCGRGQMAGGAVLVIDRLNPGAESGNRVGPLSRFGSGVGGIDEKAATVIGCAGSVT